MLTLSCYHLQENYLIFDGNIQYLMNLQYYTCCPYAHPRLLPSAGKLPDIARKGPLRFHDTNTSALTVCSLKEKLPVRKNCNNIVNTL